MRTSRTTQIPRQSRRGFSFLEIMMVVAIIGIMLAFVGPRLVGRTQKAKITAARQQIEAFKTALSSYEMQVGTFPSSEQGLESLVRRPSDVSELDWEKFMDEIPDDPWHNKYIYKFPGDHNTDYDLYSMGPNGKEGDEDDITNFNKDADSSDDF